MNGRKNQPIEERFWSKVKISLPNECWNWQASLNSTGRGMFGIGHRNMKAHRMAWILTYGNIPEGLCVLHHCDNGKCCNPAHLFLGTLADNVHDMHAKGRANILKGDDDPKSKLTGEQILYIREHYIPGHPEFSQAALGRKFGVHRTTIEAIVQRAIWKHI